MPLETLSERIRYKKIVAIVEKIASRSHSAVWHRVHDRVGQMSRNQARGYIRARAALVIQRELSIAVAENATLIERHRALIERSVRYRVIRRALSETMRLQRASVPRRKAA